MPTIPPTADDAIAEPELAEAGEPASSPTDTGNSKKRNAFSALMDPSKRPKPSASKPAAGAANHGGRSLNSAFGRDGLGPYITNPAQFTKEIIYVTDDFVAIRDAYPKATVHALLLPRNLDKTLLHPYDAFEGPEFLASVKAEIPKLQKLVATDLRHRLGKFSVAERPRIEARDADSPPKELPPGRDWEKEVITGIHAGPSMNHLHVHVLSVDHVSECMKHRKHYNSFKTPFFVRLDEFPLAKDDPRRKPDRGGHLHDDLVCWRCGQNFGNKFVQLKAHLDKEFEEWKKE